MRFVFNIQSSDAVIFWRKCGAYANDAKSVNENYRPTHTDRYVSYNSHHFVAHKKSFVRAVTDCATIIPKPHKTLTAVKPGQTEPEAFTTCSYISGSSEPIKRILNNFGIKTALKPF